MHHHVANLPHCTAAGKCSWRGPLVGRAQGISLQWARRMNQSFSSCDRRRKSLRGTQCLGYSCLLRTQLPLNSGKISTVYNKVSPFLRLIWLVSITSKWNSVIWLCATWGRRSRNWKTLTSTNKEFTTQETQGLVSCRSTPSLHLTVVASWHVFYRCGSQGLVCEN